MSGAVGIGAEFGMSWGDGASDDARTPLPTAVRFNSSGQSTRWLAGTGWPGNNHPQTQSRREQWPYHSKAGWRWSPDRAAASGVPMPWKSPGAAARWWSTIMAASFLWGVGGHDPALWPA